MRIPTAGLLALVVAGCAGYNPTRIDDSASVLDELRGENKGIVLIDTSLHCGELNARVAHPDADGRYASGELITIVSVFYLNGEPNQLVLPAGDYGLVDLACSQGNMNRHFIARPSKRGSGGDPAVYDQPIATFNVRRGEIVDVGSLQLPTSSSGFLGLQSNFRAFVMPISESKLRAFAEHKPTLYSQLVRRPMTIPGQVPQPNGSTSPATPGQRTRAPSAPVGTPVGRNG
jgi:hypothetical protein